jgi:hypothetical protein
VLLAIATMLGLTGLLRLLAAFAVADASRRRLAWLYLAAGAVAAAATQL